MTLNIREIVKVSSTGVRVTLNLMSGNKLVQLSMSGSECINLILDCESYECKKEAYEKLSESMKLYSRIVEDIKTGKCVVY